MAAAEESKIFGREPKNLVIDQMEQRLKQVEEGRVLRETGETLRRQNEYLTALHETSLGLIDRLDKEELLEAILFHRHNIRSKLRLKNKKINLRSHLLSYDR